MSFWVRLAAILRVFCFLSKFSKLFSKRLNQKVACVPGIRERQESADPEAYAMKEEGKCNVKQGLIRCDRHYVTAERNGKACGVPVMVTRVEGASGDNRRDKPSESVSEMKDRARDRPVHKAIELFDKPNDIETSLPRYQNKAPRLTNKRSPEEERRKVVPDKMGKLKEQLEQKLAARLEKCKSERDFRVRAFGDVKHRMAVKTESEVNQATMSGIEYKAKSEIRKVWKIEKEGIENIGKVESIVQKSEKEKQNCLLKVNLSQLNRSDPLTGRVEPVKSNMMPATGKSFELSERKCHKPLVERNYLNKLAKKDEKTGVEYGGGWDCHRCGERVYHAERMLACGNAYHNSCFSCVNCRKLLGPRTYLEAEMEIHCSQCHAKKFGLTGYGYGLGPGVLQTSP